jgi:hypothetical protein
MQTSSPYAWSRGYSAGVTVTQTLAVVSNSRMRILLMHFIDTCFEISKSVRDGCTEPFTDYCQSLLNRDSFSQSEIDYINFLMSGQLEPIIDRFQVFRCAMSEKEIC